MPNREQAAEAEVSAIDTIGMACARAGFVALLVGMVEGVVVSKMADASVSGIGLATAGLWVPVALFALLPGAALRRVAQRAQRRNVAFAMVAALFAALLFAKLAHVSPIVRLAPVEIVAAIGFAWVALEIEVSEAIKRPLAIFGFIVVALLQFYATRWVDAHRAFAGLLVEGTFVPRAMLRFVLRRFV
jgi:hypothetical protein